MAAPGAHWPCSFLHKCLLVGFQSTSRVRRLALRSEQQPEQAAELQGGIPPQGSFKLLRI